MNTKPARRIPRVVLAALVLVVTVMAFGASYQRADAVVFPGPYVCTYYSNASLTTAVGARGLGCCGTTISWGVTSKYKVCQELLCPDVVCPN